MPTRWCACRATKRRTAGTNVRCAGRTRRCCHWPARICPVRQITNAAVFEDSSVASAIACRIAATTCGSARPKGRGPGHRPVIHQPGQPDGLPPLPAVLERTGRDRVPGRRQLGGLRLLPRRQAVKLRVVLRLRLRPRRRIRRQPVHDLGDVPLPPPRRLHHRLRQALQPGLPARDTAPPAPGAIQIKPALRQQTGHRRRYHLADLIGQPHPGARDTDHDMRHAVDADTVPDHQLPPRCASRPHLRSPVRTSVAGPSGPSDRSAARRPCHIR